MNARLIIGLVCSLLSVSAAAHASYLCVTDLVTGFGFDKGRQQWRTAEVPDGRKYLVSKAPGEQFAWQVKEVGHAWAMAVCKQDFNEVGALTCGSFFYEFHMNKTPLWPF